MNQDIPFDSKSHLKEVADLLMEPLHSDMADDPDFLELVILFSSELPSRTQDILKAFEDKDLSSLTRLAHQLKGAAGSYGFHSITDAALELEKATHELEQDVKDLDSQVKTLTNLCQRAHLTYHTKHDS